MGVQMKKCAKCDFVYDDAYDGCPQCAKTAEGRPTAKAVSAFDGPALVGLGGAALLFVGAFMPIVSLPIVGNVNYFNNGQGDGVVLIGLALISALLVLLRRYRWLLVTSVLSLGVLGYTFITLSGRIAEMKTGLEAQLQGNPFAGLAQVAMQSVQMQWGWAVLVLGGVLLLASWGMSEARLRQSRTSTAAPAVSPAELTSEAVVRTGDPEREQPPTLY
jgi:hypothetical protein